MINADTAVDYVWSGVAKPDIDGLLQARMHLTVRWSTQGRHYTNPRKPMNIRTFVLKVVDCAEDDIFAVGMSITNPSGVQHNVVFRPGRDDCKGILMNTSTPERARELCDYVVPVDLEWWDGGGDDMLFSDRAEEMSFHAQN